MFLRPSLICLLCPSSVLFSDMNKKGSHVFFFSNINIFLFKMNKKGASLGFNKIKSGLSHLFFFFGNKNENLPASCFSKKWPEKHLFIF